MTAELLVESALRTLALGGIVWLGLALLRVRNPHAHMTAWTVVLVASLAMPVLMHRITLAIPAPPPAAHVVEAISTLPLPSSPPEVRPAAVPVPMRDSLEPAPEFEPRVLDPPRGVTSDPLDWRSWITGIYALVAGMMLLRLLTGIALTWRIARAARPVHDRWAAGADVRVSDAVVAPVTFGSTVLLPSDCIEWSSEKLRAVLSHEGSHVAHGDFYVLLLAAINRAVFWFSPFAWWQLKRLAELAEIISDDAAVETLQDRPFYAGILIDVARSIRRPLVALAMARACTVGRRVERILNATAVSPNIDWRSRMLIAAVVAPVVVISAGTITLRASTPQSEPVAVEPALPSPQVAALDAAASRMAAARPLAAVDAAALDFYVGHYAADPRVLPDLVLTVTREGDHLFVQKTGQAKLAVFPEGNHAFFFAAVDQKIMFEPEGGGRASALVLHLNGMKVEAKRVDAAAAARAAELLDKRFAEQAMPRDAVAADPKLLDRYVGYYQLNPRSVFTIAREGDQLVAQLTGRPRRPLLAASEREYFYKSVAAQITFVADGAEPASALVLHQNGREFPAARVDEAQARAAEALAQEEAAVRADQERPRTAIAVDPQLYDRYAGLYQRGPNSIFAVTRDDDRLFVQLTGQRKLEVLPASDHEFFYRGATGQVSFVTDGLRSATMLIVRQNGSDSRALRIADLPRGSSLHGEAARSVLDGHVGWYAFDSGRALAVTSAGDRLVVHETGRQKLELLAHSDHEFVSRDGDAFIIFGPRGEGRSTELLFHEPASGARRAMRVESAQGQALERAFARRVAAAPDRFKDQTPAEGSRAAVLQWIEDMQRGAPSYQRMSPQLVSNVRQQVSRLHSMLAALGSVESIFFRGVGPGGYDIYGAKFTRGLAEIRLLIGPDGTTEDLVFRPDGDDTPGGVVACSDEPSLKSPLDTAPIKLLFYNRSGADIHAFVLDLEGKRARQITIGDERTAPIMTYVGRPWVIADASGRCTEIVLPGYRTRHVIIEPRETGDPNVRWAARRTTPTPGTEEALRRYIEALGRGEPDYARLTADVATETRRQLLLHQAILTKFGALRAISFRAVSPLGSDIYVAHFANGSAEWRIGLAKDGRIARIILGPQS